MCPYEKLYVYLLSGVLPKTTESALGSSFIGNWVEGSNSFLFFKAPSRDRVTAVIASQPGLQVLEEFVLDYDQWQGETLRPMEIAGFLIRPHWQRKERQEYPPDLQEILLDPGVVFGNGLHPTTRDCLRAIRWIMDRQRVETVLDLGTGTGILAIAATLLGAGDVVAVDINPLCVKTARKNVHINAVEDRIRVVEGSAFDFATTRADLVVANLDYDVINRLLETSEFRTIPWYIFSGLMITPYRNLKELIVRCDLQICREWDHAMTWFTVACKGRFEE